jgi:integrase
MVLPLEPTEVPGVYRRGSKFVAVYRVEGRQRKQAVDTLADARAIKLQRDGEARAVRRGPTLHAFSLSWLDRYAGTGHDSVRANTRREYRRLLVNFALTYFDREVRVRELDRAAVQHFVDWLTTRPGREGRLCDSSIANVLTPLRLTLGAAVAEGLLNANPAEQVVLPRRRAGRAWSTRERRYLTRAELARLLDEVPPKWGPLFELLAATGLRISEAVGLRWSDLVLDGATPHLRVRRAIVKGALVAPKSRHGARLIPLTPDLAAMLRPPTSRRRRRRVRVSWPRRCRARSRQSAPSRARPCCRARRPDRRQLPHSPSHVGLAGQRRHVLDLARVGHLDLPAAAGEAIAHPHGPAHHLETGAHLRAELEHEPRQPVLVGRHEPLPGDPPIGLLRAPRRAPIRPIDSDILHQGLLASDCVTKRQFVGAWGPAVHRIHGRLLHKPPASSLGPF